MGNFQMQNIYNIYFSQNSQNNVIEHNNSMQLKYEWICTETLATQNMLVGLIYLNVLQLWPTEPKILWQNQ